MYSDIIRTGIERQKLKIECIATDDGNAIGDCYFNESARPISGFIPVKYSVDDKSTTYISASKVRYIRISDAEQDNMRYEIIKPKENG